MKETLQNNPHWNSVRNALGVKPKSPEAPPCVDSPAVTITALPISRLKPFKGHPYQVREDDALAALSESIRENGVLSPVIVRRLEGTDDYEIVSGHRRTKAASLAGLSEVPVIVVDIDRDAAVIKMVDSNLHREHLLPSEKAFAYKMKLEAISHQGKKTSVQVAPKLSTDLIGESENVSKDTIKRYIRLTYLDPELLAMVDEGRISFTPAVELSYLSEEMQQALLAAIESEDCTPSLSQACRMKKLFVAGQLTDDDIFDILAEEKPNQREMVKIPLDTLQHFFPDYTPNQIRDAIVRMLEQQAKVRQPERKACRDSGER